MCNSFIITIYTVILLLPVKQMSSFKVVTDTPPSDHHGEKPLENKPPETPNISADRVPNINEASQKDTEVIYNRRTGCHNAPR